MPTDVARALSLQQQRALELTATAAAGAAAALLQAMSRAKTRGEVEQLAAQYELLLLGAMSAAASTRVGYLELYAAAEGLPVFTLPAGVTRPTVQDVLVGGSGKLPEPEGVVPHTSPPAQAPLRAPSSQGPMWAAMQQLKRDMEEAQALSAALQEISDATEATVMATSDWVDSMVLGPSKHIAALRRVAHPGACERCMRASGVLIFKSSPRPRHPQCRCSFEPVDVNDGEYKARLAKYERNSRTTASSGPGGTAWARGTRSRGRRQMEDARRREEHYQEVWAAFLRDEQTRLADLVTAIPSNTYKSWAIMTSANIAETVSNPLPVITRK